MANGVEFHRLILNGNQAMLLILKQLLDDEAGFIVSAELVLVGTIAVLSMVVGLASVSNAVNSELNDVAQAFDSANQSYRYSGRNGQGGYRDRSENGGAGNLSISGIEHEN
jgi:Flp pilus assembly pilin Flp